MYETNIILGTCYLVPAHSPPYWRIACDRVHNLLNVTANAGIKQFTFLACHCHNDICCSIPSMAHVIFGRFEVHICMPMHRLGLGSWMWRSSWASIKCRALAAVIENVSRILPSLSQSVAITRGSHREHKYRSRYSWLHSLMSPLVVIFFGLSLWTLRTWWTDDLVIVEFVSYRQQFHGNCGRRTAATGIPSCCVVLACFECRCCFPEPPYPENCLDIWITFHSLRHNAPCIYPGPKKLLFILLHSIFAFVFLSLFLWLISLKLCISVSITVALCSQFRCHKTICLKRQIYLMRESPQKEQTLVFEA